MEWKPIESAPKDGTVFLATVAFGDGVTTTEWSDVVAVYWDDCTLMPDDGEEPGWVVREIPSGNYSCGGELTHWTPLPAPPSLPEEAREQPASLAADKPGTT